MALGGRKAGFYSNQPTRTTCGKCGKRGVGIWHYMHEYGLRWRDCRYCHDTERQVATYPAGENLTWETEKSHKLDQE